MTFLKANSLTKSLGVNEMPPFGSNRENNENEPCLKH